MTPEEWRHRGRSDRAKGVPRAAAPSAEDTMPGREWRIGWDDADAGIGESAPETMETLDVHLELRKGRLVLMDTLGRQIGVQTNCVVQQDEDTVASVTFVGLKIITREV